MAVVAPLGGTRKHLGVLVATSQALVEAPLEDHVEFHLIWTFFACQFAPPALVIHSAVFGYWNILSPWRAPHHIGRVSPAMFLDIAAHVLDREYDDEKHSHGNKLGGHRGLFGYVVLPNQPHQVLYTPNIIPGWPN